MKKRKQTIIDKKFQLGTTFSIIGVIYIIFSVIIAAIGINAAYNNQKLTTIIKKHKSIISTQYETFSALLVFDQNKTWKDLQIATDKVSKDIDKNMETINNNILTVNNITFRNNVFLLVIVIFIVLQGAVLYLLLIRKTHRMSGPIFLLTRYTQEIIDGKYPEIRPLRDKDEFKEYYELFTRMVEVLKERGKGE